MCNINIIKSYKGKDKRITEAMNVVSFNSYLGNDDAEGWYGDGFKVKKSEEKQIMKGEYSFLISHQRRSTSGKNEKMAQPLESEHFILMHNGVFNGLGNTKQSDTFDYLQKLEDSYKQTQNTIRTIQEINKDMGGYYSIVLYNKKTKEHYYYKDSAATMYYVKTSKLLLASTDKDNVEYLKKYFSTNKEIEKIDPLKIFDIDNKFKSIGEFEEYIPPKREKTKSISYRDSIKSSWWTGNWYDKRSLTRTRVVEILNEFGIEPVSVGIHGDTALIGISREDIGDFVDMFPSSQFVRVKENSTKEKYLYMIEADSFDELSLVGY